MDRVLEKKRWTPKKIGIIAGAAAVLSFLLYSVIFADHKSSLNVKSDRLTLGQVSTGTFEEFIAIDGSVEPYKSVFLDIVEGGRVEKLFTDDGRKVEKGDTIIKLTNSTLQVDFMNRESQLYDLINQRSTSEVTMKQDQIRTLNSIAEIDFQLSTAKRAFERNEDLVKDKVIPREEFEKSKDEYLYLKKKKVLAQRSLKQDSLLMHSRLKQLDESIRRMRENINLSRSTLNNLYVIAPISGQLSTLKAEVGESKTPGANIGQIDDLNGFKVLASVDQHYISRISPGLEGEFDFNGQTYPLKITKVLPEVTNGEFRAEMEFPEGKTPEGIRRGQTLQIRLKLSSGQQATLIPRGGFYQSTGGSWVFVVNKDGEYATKRNVRLGRQNPQFYEVLDGLQPGEKVVISSYDGYGDIEKLSLKN